MSVYKNFSANDVAVIPFNAHKQYTFDYTSAASNKVTYFDTRWTSESIDLYSVPPKVGNLIIGKYIIGSITNDGINTIKYNQLDHLYYRNFKRDLANRFGDKDYLGQQRVLYENAGIFSIPAGLYGHEIKPGTFSISASVFGPSTIIDDSKGNLIVSGINLSNFETDVRANVLNIGPVKGFKRYDLNTYNNLVEGVFDKRGESIVNSITSYSTPKVGDEFDDSYYSNIIRYTDVNFSPQPNRGYSQIDFNGSTSEIRVGNNEKYNFNPGDDFTLALFTNISHSTSETTYLLSKSTTKTVVPSPSQGAEIYTTTTTGSLQPLDTYSEPQYPFEIYATGNEIFFERSDSNIITTYSASITLETNQHITCRVSSSEMEIFINGVGSGISGSDNCVLQTQNNANIYIGNKGGISNYLSGSLSQINIFNKALTDTQILYQQVYQNNSPYVGNIFYSSGMVAITSPIWSGFDFVIIDPVIKSLKFQGSHLIYENEYQCTVDEHEFNDTTNISARKIRSSTSQDLADFATGSLFKPYVTTVGLYNEKKELLVVGKFGQPIRMSDETDTTFVLRWDT